MQKTHDRFGEGLLALTRRVAGRPLLPAVLMGRRFVTGAPLFRRSSNLGFTVGIVCVGHDLCPRYLESEGLVAFDSEIAVSKIRKYLILTS